MLHNPNFGFPMFSNVYDPNLHVSVCVMCEIAKAWVITKVIRLHPSSFFTLSPVMIVVFHVAVINFS